MIVPIRLVYDVPDSSTYTQRVGSPELWYVDLLYGVEHVKEWYSACHLHVTAPMTTLTHNAYTHFRFRVRISFPLIQTSVRIHSDNTLRVQISMDSRNRTIHNVYHISLHSSSCTEPTHKSVHKLYYAFRYHAEYTSWTCARNFVRMGEPSLWAALRTYMYKFVYVTRMILPQVHLRKPCYDFSFL